VIVRRGTAGFQVAAGDRRPFIVQAGDLSLDGAGANFAVGVDSAKVAVNVAGGVVQAARRTARGPETCAIGASLRLVSRSDVPLQASRVPEAEMSRELAWRRGLLIFDGERLSEAVARLNRYSRTPIVIEDPALAQRTFVGVFEAGDSRAFARTAATAFNAQVVEADGALRLSRR
jgi:transmembrane sensor